MIIFGGGVARAGGKEPNSPGCMTALYFNGIPAGHTLSRAALPRGPHRGHQAVGEMKTVILERGAEGKPPNPGPSAQTRQQRKGRKQGWEQQGPSSRRDGEICFSWRGQNQEPATHMWLILALWLSYTIW